LFLIFLLLQVSGSWLLVTGNLQLPLSLALLEAGILFVNYKQLAFSANNFAVGATLFDGCSNFHNYVVCSQPSAVCYLFPYL